MLKETKEIFDPIHGYIKITKLAQLFIHTPQFQRLRYLHQLGTCHYVFPCATHTRFEHSIGTYHLAGRVLEAIKKNSDPKLIKEYLALIPELNCEQELNSYVCELVKIAALCHDIGHGPFSHVFDDIFMTNVGNGKNEMEYHENRSCAIIKYIISKNHELRSMIRENEVNFICNLINPQKHHEGFIYQIVSNNLNGVDVDKFDYIQRDTYNLGLKYSIDADRIIADMKVIDNKICYTLKVHYDIVSLFTTRYRLHKQIYTHKTVISTQYMIRDIMIVVNKFFNIYDSIFDVEKFIDVTEEYIIILLKLLYREKDNEKYTVNERKEIEYAYNLWIRLNERKLYELVKLFVTDNKINISDIQDRFGDTIICYQGKIGYVSGSKTNPLDDIYFYSHKDNVDKCFKISIAKDKTSHLISSVYQEYVTMIFVKDKSDNKTKTELINFIDSICIDEKIDGI